MDEARGANLWVFHVIDVAPMTKAELTERIAEATGLTRIETEAVIEGFMICVREALVEGNRVDLRGFGAFQVQHRAERSARNPVTGKEIAIPARYAPVFKPARELRDVVAAAHPDAHE